MEGKNTKNFYKNSIKNQKIDKITGILGKK